MTPDGTELDADPDDEPVTPVTAHRSSPGRTVFVEDGNSDGWIATDLAVDLER